MSQPYRNNLKVLDVDDYSPDDTQSVVQEIHDARISVYSTRHEQGRVSGPKYWYLRRDRSVYCVAGPGDITYVWTDEGLRYVAVVLDLNSRAVIGWAIGPH